MSHSHVLYDADPHFKINTKSRTISNESGKTTLVQYDHNSERFTFEADRYIDGHDLSLCNSVEIHYLNIESATKRVGTGVYTVDDLHVKESDPNTIVFSWVIARNATQLIGQLNFIVRFACVSETTGAVEYAWHTTIHSGTMISTGIYNGETGSDNPVPAFNFVTSVTGTQLRFFVGTQVEYDALDVASKVNLFAFITDNETREGLITQLSEVVTWINEVTEGLCFVPKAEYATEAGSAERDADGNVIATTYMKVDGDYESVYGGTHTLSQSGTYHVQMRRVTGNLDPTNINYLAWSVDFGLVRWVEGGSVFTSAEGYNCSAKINYGTFYLVINETGKVQIFRKQTGEDSPSEYTEGIIVLKKIF